MMKLSAVQREVLRMLVGHPRIVLGPTRKALLARGLAVEYAADADVLEITDAGRAALAEAELEVAR